ncbi:MAG: LURP-one-related family protein [Bacillota bacterium]
MKLYIKQKIFSIGDKYDIYDQNQNAVYSAWGEVFALGNKLHLCDASGKEVVFIKQRLLTLLPKFELIVNGELFATINKKFTFFYKKIEVESPYGNITIDGSFWDHDYSISVDGKLFGSVHKVWMTWGDSYELDINTEDHPEFFVALVLAIDSILEGEKNHN